MQISIKEDVGRACCHPGKDLRKVYRSPYEPSDRKFCVHCGRQWLVHYWTDTQMKAEAAVRGLRNDDPIRLLIATNAEYGGASLEPQRFSWDSDLSIKRLLFEVFQHVKHAGEFERVPDAWR